MTLLLPTIIIQCKSNDSRMPTGIRCSPHLTRLKMGRFTSVESDREDQSPLLEDEEESFLLECQDPQEVHRTVKQHALERNLQWPVKPIDKHEVSQQKMHHKQPQIRKPSEQM